MINSPYGKRPLGRPRSRWVDNAKIGWGGVDRIDLAQDRGKWSSLVNAVMVIRVPYNVGKLLSA
jgi:hypothetical protein